MATKNKRVTLCHWWNFRCPGSKSLFRLWHSIMQVRHRDGKVLSCQEISIVKEEMLVDKGAQKGPFLVIDQCQHLVQIVRGALERRVSDLQWCLMDHQIMRLASLDHLARSSSSRFGATYQTHRTIRNHVWFKVLDKTRAREMKHNLTPKKTQSQETCSISAWTGTHHKPLTMSQESSSARSTSICAIYTS